MSITEEEDDGTSDEDVEDEEEDLSEDDDYDFYYGGDNEDLDDSVQIGSGSQFNNNDDPEYLAYECLSVVQVKDFLAEIVSSVCASIQVLATQFGFKCGSKNGIKCSLLEG